MITTMQERIYLIIARKKKHPASESILMCLMHIQGINIANHAHMHAL